MRPCRSRRAATSSGSPPRTALMPVGVTALAAAMARPRSRTKTIACSSVSDPGHGGGGDLADRVPGRARRRGAGAASSPGWSNRAEQADQAGADDERLGDRGVLDRVGVGDGAVGDEVEPGDRGEPAQPVAHPGQLEPGGEEAGGLGALSRADESEHVLQPCLCACDLVVTERHEQSGPDLEGSSKVRRCRGRGRRSRCRGTPSGATRGAVGWASRPTARAIRTMLASRGWVRS